MRNVFKIFAGDIRSLLPHFFATVVVIAIMIIPALYAWVNIYANSDPYGNTGNISVAVASDDKGYEGENEGEAILDGLRDNDSIGWVFTDSEDAVAGVESGKYYAAIVINENFSRNMFDLNSALTDESGSLTFYQNAKKNPVANKITETAADTVRQNVQVEYLKVLFQTVFTEAQSIGDEANGEETVSSVISQLTDLSSSLRSYGDAVGEFASDTSKAAYLLQNVGTSMDTASAKGAVSSAQGSVQNAKSALDTLSSGIDDKLSELQTDLDELTAALNKLASSEALNAAMETRNELVSAAQSANAQLQAHLEALRAILPENSALSGTAYVANTLDALITRCKQTDTQLELLHDDTSYAEDAANITAACSDMVSLTRSTITNQLKSGIDAMLTNLSSTLELLYPLIDSLGVTLDDASDVANSAGSALSSVCAALTRLQSLMTRSADAVDKLLSDINGASEDERLQTLITVLNGNAEKYAEFLSSPVSVTEETIFPAASYGDAMTPFYTALALWVGGVILVAIIKTKAEPRRVRNVTQAQLFWGRFILFVLLSEIQAAVTVLGDIYLLNCRVVHPVMFWFAAAVTSFAFISIIYSLTISFGDIGKAIVIVVVVLQVAGSSGSYPIELLPDIFSKIYLFLPFPYGINAMREAMFGLYGNDYWIYLGETMLFAVGGLFIGLVVRKPFIGVNRFVEQEIEDSGVL